MSVRQRIKSTAIFKGLLAGFIFISAASFAAEKTEIKVGVIDSFNPEFSTQTLEPTLKFLNSKLPAYRFVPVSLNSVNPDKELKNNPVDFLILKTLFTSLRARQFFPTILRHRRRALL